MNNNINILEDMRVLDFIKSLDTNDVSENEPLSKLLCELEIYAKENDVPIIREEAKELLTLLCKITKPQKILEIGTAIGYSTIILHSSSDAEIITIENYDKRIIEAKKNLEKYSIIKEHNIQLIEDDAINFFMSYKEMEIFDFVFLDAAKAQYIVWLPYIKKLMKKGAILVADNIFKEGDILESKFLIRKRDRTIHKRMREYLRTIKNDSELSTYIFNIADGVAISIKK